MATSIIKGHSYITGAVSIASGWTDTASYVRKNDSGVVEFYIQITGGTLTRNAWNTVAALPEGFRPISYYDDALLDNGNGGVADVKVQADGEVKVYAIASTTNDLRLRGMFLT